MDKLELSVFLKTSDQMTKPMRDSLRAITPVNAEIKRLGGELKNLERQQRQLGQYRALKTNLVEQKHALQAARDKASALNHALANNANASKQQAAAAKRASETVAKLTAQYSRQQSKLAELRRAMGNSGTVKMISGQREVERAIENTNRAIDKQQRKLEQLNARSAHRQQISTGFNQSMSGARDMAMTGMGYSYTASAMTNAMARAVSPGVQFSGEASRVYALARLDPNSEESQALRAQAMRLGSETAFTANQAAQGQAFLAMAGFTPEAIEGAMPGMLNVAQAAGLELGETADITSNILSAYGMDPAQEMNRLGDVLSATFTRTNTDLLMLGETIKYTGPAAAAVNAQVEETAAMAGLLGNVGIQGSMAGTTLRSVYTRLATQPKAASDALEQLGVSAKDAEGNLRAVPDILKDIYEASEDLGDAERLELFKGIAGQHAVSGFAELVNVAGDGQLHELIETLQQSQGESQNIAAAMLDNAQGDWVQLQSALEGLSITFAEVNQGAIRELLQSTTEIVRNITGFVEKHPEMSMMIAKLAGGVTALVGAMGALALGGAAVKGGVGTARSLWGLASYLMGSVNPALQTTVSRVDSVGAAMGRSAGGANKLMTALSRSAPYLAAIAGSIAYIGYQTDGFEALSDAFRSQNGRIERHMQLQSEAGAAVQDHIRRIEGLTEALGGAAGSYDGLGAAQREFLKQELQAAQTELKRQYSEIAAAKIDAVRKSADLMNDHKYTVKVNAAADRGQLTEAQRQAALKVQQMGGQLVSISNGIGNDTIDESIERINAYQQEVESLINTLPEKRQRSFAFLLEEAAKLEEIALTRTADNTGFLINEIAATEQKLAELEQSFATTGQNAADKLSAGFQQAAPAMQAAMQKLLSGNNVSGIGQGVSKLLSAASQLLQPSKIAAEFTQSGQSISKGLADGVRGSTNLALTATRQLALQSATAMRAAFGINSPSRVTMVMGTHIGEGLAIGINQGAPLAVSAVRAMMSAVHAEYMRGIAALPKNIPAPRVTPMRSARSSNIYHDNRSNTTNVNVKGGEAKSAKAIAREVSRSQRQSEHLTSFNDMD